MKVLHSENYYNDVDRLAEITGFTTQEIENDFYNLFDSDPDIIRLNGEESLFAQYGDLIVYSGNECKEIESILLDFFKTDYDKSFQQEDQTWEKFRSLETAIAYRGGKGYRYTIWSLKNKEV